MKRTIMKRSSIYIANVVWLLVCIMSVSLPYAAGAPATRPAPPENYVLGPGDQLEVTVYGEPDLSRGVTIKPDGSIALSLIGEIKASGKTTGQLEGELTKLYSKYLKSPSISVVVHELRIDRVYLLGQIKQPGEIQLRPNARILELLATAGGPTNRADLAKAVVIRGKTETIKLDLVSALAKNQDPDVKLLPGDVLFIPETDRRITALGEVKVPGAYDLLDGQRISDLLAAAGGPTPKAGLTKAFIMRESVQIPIDLKRVLSGDLEANTALKAGDMLVVPENKDKVAVLGAVNKPGPIDLAENMTLVQALAEAGGPTDTANLKGLQIVRYVAGKPTTIKVKGDQVVQGKDGTENVQLKTGDFVYVPPKGKDLFDILGVIGGFMGFFGL